MIGPEGGAGLVAGKAEARLDRDCRTLKSMAVERGWSLPQLFVTLYMQIRWGPSIDQWRCGIVVVESKETNSS